MTHQTPSAEPSTPLIRRGTCHVVYAFDVATSIDLDGAERRIAAAQRQIFTQKGRAPSYFEYQPAPLRVTWQTPTHHVSGITTRDAVELVMYDFGAVSLSFELPLLGPLGDLVALAAALRGHAELRAAARKHVEQLMEVLGDAAARPKIASFVEDYIVFQVDELDPPEPAPRMFQREAGLMARILRAETRELSEQERSSATALQGSFGPGDLTIIDTDAALVFDPDAADVLAVIEFANAQILEMRVLDQQLDDALERSYHLLSRPRLSRAALAFYDPDLRLVSQLQLDAAILFERVTNALKLIGEQYLTRIYGHISQRFHLAEWDASITRKLQTVDSIYSKLSDRATSRRMELLEWVIILLIAFEIVLTLTGLGN
ncbi:MAG: hypothetical protein EXR93_09400 [Gemmatimonadetes bacterium]|nr:hypothetical protein [Gemmatimonadota bacterium]